MIQNTELQEHAYLSDTLLTQRETVVLDTGNLDGSKWVAVKHSIFHPQGGGQPADAGWIDGVPVVPVRDRASGLIVLVAATEEPLPDYTLGDSVVTRIDRDLRLLHAALHTAGHLIEAVSQPKAWLTVATNHFPGQSRVEFASSAPEIRLTDTEGRAIIAAELQHAVEAAIQADLPVTSSVDAEGHRVVHLGNTHKVPCGGTHVRSLAELSDVIIPPLRVKKGRIKVAYSAVHAGGV